MPQLIAMVIVVVGAMIYMFQTFGGTGDKIEGVAQKASIITEINNIKDGIKIAAKSQQIANSASGDKVSTLSGLGIYSYFAEQINEQVKANATFTGGTAAADTNAYYAISFGGEDPDNKGGMILKLVAPAAVSGVKRIPGIYVEFTGTLLPNAGFLESQLTNDLSSVAYIDRAAGSAAAAAGVIDDTGTPIEKRTPAMTAASPTAVQLADGKFIIYFKDFGSDEVVD